MGRELYLTVLRQPREPQPKLHAHARHQQPRVRGFGVFRVLGCLGFGVLGLRVIGLRVFRVKSFEGLRLLGFLRF
jgi:hypothetical protein